MKTAGKSSFWFSSIIFTLLQRFSPMVFSLFGVMLLSKYLLTKVDMGGYSLLQLIITTIEYVKMGLLRNAVIKIIHQPENANKKAEVQSAALLINAVFSVIVALFFLFGGGLLLDLFHSPELITALRLSAVIMLLQIPFNHCEIVQQSNLQYKRTFMAYFIRNGLLFAFIFVGWLAFRQTVTVNSLIIAQIIGMVIAVLYYMHGTKQFLSKTFRYDRMVVKNLLSFGKYVFGTALLSNIYGAASQYVSLIANQNAELGKAVVAVYSLVQRISNVLDAPSLAIADILMPKNSQAMGADAGKERVKYYFERMTGALTAIMLPISFAIFVMAPWVINFISGKAYAEAVPILQITMFFTFIRPFYNQFGYTMDSIGLPRTNFFVGIFLMIMGLASAFYGIRTFGPLMGPVYAAQFSYVAGSVLIYIILRKHLGISARNIVVYTFHTYKELFAMIRKRLKPSA